MSSRALQMSFANQFTNSRRFICLGEAKFSRIILVFGNSFRTQSEVSSKDPSPYLVSDFSQFVKSGRCPPSKRQITGKDDKTAAGNCRKLVLAQMFGSFSFFFAFSLESQAFT